jgi:hypothetical protein
VNALIAALCLLAVWAAGPLVYAVEALRQSAPFAVFIMLVRALTGAALLALAARALHRRERLFAFTLTAASMAYLLYVTKWALIAGIVVMMALALEGFFSESTGTASLDPYDMRLLAAAAAITLTWLLLLASNRLMPFIHHALPGGERLMMSSGLLLAALVPGLTTLYQLVRAALTYPEGRDRLAAAPLAAIALSFLLIFVS